MMTTTMTNANTLSIFNAEGVEIAYATWSDAHERAIYTCLRTYENRDFRDLAAVDQWVADCNAEQA